MSTPPPGLDPSLQVPDVRPDAKESIFSALSGAIAGGSGADSSKMDASIKRHHEARLNEARMHRQNAATAAGALMTGIDPQTGQPFTPEREKYFHDTYQAAMAAYEKAAGVSKEHKGFIAKAKGFLEHIIGLKQQAKQGQGQMSPPPQAASPESDEGSQQTGMAKPPVYGDLEQMQMPELRREMGVTQDVQAATQKSQAAFAQREKEAEQIGLKKGTREYAEFVGTGKFSSKGRLQKMVYTDPKDGEVKDGSYDPDSGEILDQKGNVVEGAKPASTASMSPKEIHYLSPDGKPLFGFRVGMKLYDQAGRELPEGTEFFTRGMLPTETLRQVITYDAQGNPQINTLETMRTPLTGGGKTTQSAPARKGAMSPPPSAGGTGATKGGGVGGTAQNVDALGKPLGMSASQQKAQTQRVTAVREATTQVFGDPDNPNFKPLKDFAYLADSPESREKIGTALKYTFDGMEQLEKQHGSLMALVQAYGGIPQALAAAKASVQRDVIDKLSSDEQDAFDATISSFSSVVGLRSLTSASAAQFSVKALERDIPMIGLTATSSRMFNDKLAHIGEIALNGAKTISDTVMPPAEKDYLKQRLQELRGLPKGTPTAPKKSNVVPIRKGGATPPPKLNESVDDEILRLAGAGSGRP